MFEVLAIFVFILTLLLFLGVAVDIRRSFARSESGCLCPCGQWNEGRNTCSQCGKPLGPAEFYPRNPDTF
jgi:hypothetical protein